MRSIKHRLQVLAISAFLAVFVVPLLAAVVVNDTFTDTAGTALDSHTGETGATWTNTVGAGVAAISDVNRARMGPINSVIYQHTASGTAATAEYDVEVDIVTLALNATLDGAIGVKGREQGNDSGIFYLAYYSFPNARWELNEVSTAGIDNILGTFAQVLSISTTYHLKLVLRNGAKSVLIDGVTRIGPSASNGIAAAGKCGLFGVTDSVTDIDNTHGPHWDSFTCTDDPTPAGGAGGYRSLLGVGR